MNRGQIEMKDGFTWHEKQPRAPGSCFGRPAWLLVIALLVALGGRPLPTLSAKQQAAAKRTDSLRAAIVDLMDTFNARYPDGSSYLAQLDQIEGRLSRATPESSKRLEDEYQALKKKALTANPLVSSQPLLFTVREQYLPDHHNTATMFQTSEINSGSFRGGGALKTIHFGQDLLVTTLYQSPQGVARDPDVDFNGRKILFSLRHDPRDDYHIYEMDLDSNVLKQLTFGSGISDIDPIYLPDGKIIFSSTREPKYCMCNRHVMCNLFTMNGDGSGIEQIGHSTLHEGHASLSPDGRIIYDRWEYVDRNFGDAQGVWSANPDGTNHALYWGNNTNSPGAVLDAREIPGTGQFLATFSSCHDRPWGALALVDRRIGLDGKRPVVRTWPTSAIELVGQGDYDTFKRVDPKHEDPFPLSDKYFLCVRTTTGVDARMGIFLLDLFGNEILLHSEEAGCFDPMPLAPRPRPRAIPTRVDQKNNNGYFYVADVHLGSGMENIARGGVKFLRVVESPEKRFWTHTAWNGSGTQAPGMAWNDFNNKRILGTVPVEADGSAYFSVPADTFVYFQLLDEKGMMIQSMRSGTIVRPGEKIGCVGCHDNRRTSVPNRPTLALARGPSPLTPWHGPARKFNYMTEVQPVFDQHCVSCHDYENENGKELNLAGDMGLIFNTSYVELRSKNYVHVPGAGPATVMPPRSWGAYVSPLVSVLLNGHKDQQIDQQIRLDQQSFDRIVTWIDINAPYYPDYASAYPDNAYGRSPLAPAQLKRLSELTGFNLNDQKFSAHVNFTRPEQSPCLDQFEDRSDPRYQQGLSIIRTGAELLSRHPRADMPGFRLTGVDAERQAKYTHLVEKKPQRQTSE
jgi:hydrazine synthase alpha subunit-like protein/WD40 repeat protein